MLHAQYVYYLNKIYIYVNYNLQIFVRFVLDFTDSTIFHSIECLYSYCLRNPIGALQIGYNFVA